MSSNSPRASSFAFSLSLSLSLFLSLSPSLFVPVLAHLSLGLLYNAALNARAEPDCGSLTD